MTDVLFVVRGRPGLGHVTPSVAVAKKLPANIDFKFVSYDVGADLLDREQFGSYRIRGPILGQRRCPWLELLEIEDEMTPIIEKEKPKLVVVDGEYYLPMFCKSLGIKNIILTTTNYVEASVWPYKKYLNSMKILFGYADMVMVHGIKPPKTKIESNFIGPIVGETDKDKDKLREGLKQDAKILISVTKGGGELEHMLDIEKYREDSRIMLDVCKKVQKKFDHDMRFVYFSGGCDKAIDSKGFVPNILNYFAISDIVIANAGLVTTEELAYLLKPSILVVPRGDEEKLENAKAAKRIGFADFLEIANFNENSLIEKINRMLKNKRKISKLSILENGTEAVVKNIMELLK